MSGVQPRQRGLAGGALCPAVLNSSAARLAQRRPLIRWSRVRELGDLLRQLRATYALPGERPPLNPLAELAPRRLGEPELLADFLRGFLCAHLHPAPVAPAPLAPPGDTTPPP